MYLKYLKHDFSMLSNDIWRWKEGKERDKERKIMPLP